jgi:phytoene dehydrogenase-like protein
VAQSFKPPATQRLYDVCVVGSQLGGVVAGALLARRGFRVLHVAHDDPGFHYVDHGYQLPFGPAVVPTPRHSPSAEAVLAELGLATDLGRALAPTDPDLQLLLPRHRVDVSRDPARLRAELRREWPKEVDALETGFSTLSTLFDFAGFFLRAAPPLPPDGLMERLAVRKALKTAASMPGAPSKRADEAQAFQGLEGHELVQSLAVAHRFLTYLDGPPSPLSQVRLLGGALRGTNRLPGGLGSLRELVRRRIAESRGELRGGPGEPAVASALVVQGKQIEAVRLADSPDAHVARVFIVATDASRFVELLPTELREGKATAPLRAVRATRQLCTVNLVVKETALPPALGENVLALRDAAGGDGLDNAVFLQVLPARRDGKKGEKGAPEVVAGERVVCASAFVDAAIGRTGLDAAATAIREAIADAIPFFERHLVAESPVFVAADGGGASAAHPLYEAPDEDALGVAGIPVKSSFKNVFFAGREVIPGLGLEGEFYAGIQAAAHAALTLGRKDILKR